MQKSKEIKLFFLQDFNKDSVYVSLNDSLIFKGIISTNYAVGLAHCVKVNIDSAKNNAIVINVNNVIKQINTSKSYKNNYYIYYSKKEKTIELSEKTSMYFK
jgi:hypothetical protein